MKQNYLLDFAFNGEGWEQRWADAIQSGVDKGIKFPVLQAMCDSEWRANTYQLIKEGRYDIAPPYVALIPKDDGTNRMVFVNQPPDRVLSTLFNNILFELMPEMVHPSCLSYQKGKSCPDIVKAFAKTTVEGQHRGWKSDLSKYFDSVPVEYIDRAFDRIIEKFGDDAMVEMFRRYYHSEMYLDKNDEGKWQVYEKYQSLKQGCAVASWLADVVLYELDDKLSKLNGLYCRYSDDMMFKGMDYKKAMKVLEDGLAEMQMKLNPNKVEWIDDKHWTSFLGFALRGSEISLSKKAVKRLQKEIDECCKFTKTKTKTKTKNDNDNDNENKATQQQNNTTTKPTPNSSLLTPNYKRALQRLYKLLYNGYKNFSWAARVLRTINVEKDIDTINEYIMDSLRAVLTGRRHIGGLGWQYNQKEGVIMRGVGKNVTSNRERTDKQLEGYYSLRFMRNAIATSRAAFDAIVRTELRTRTKTKTITKNDNDNDNDNDNENDNTPTSSLLTPNLISRLETLYAIYRSSSTTNDTSCDSPFFKAKPYDKLSKDDLLYGADRYEARMELEGTLKGAIEDGSAMSLFKDGEWFWKSERYDDLVILRDWMNLIHN